MMSVLCVPFTPLYSFIGSWVFGSFLCRVLSMAQCMSVYLSALTLTVIAYDRYRVILYPFIPRMTMRGCLYRIMFMWIISTIISCPLAFFQKVVKYPNNPSRYCEEFWPSSTIRISYSVVNIMAQFILPLIFISYFYQRVSKEMSKNSKKQIHGLKKKAERRDIKRKKKINIMLITMIILFSLCWLPLNFVIIFFDVNSHLVWWKYYTLVFFLSHMLAMSSICHNPLLYAWFNPNFRNEFQNILPCIRKKGTRYSIIDNPSKIINQSKTYENDDSIISPKFNGKKRGVKDSGISSTDESNLKFYLKPVSRLFLKRFIPPKPNAHQNYVKKVIYESIKIESSQKPSIAPINIKKSQHFQNDINREIIIPRINIVRGSLDNQVLIYETDPTHKSTVLHCEKSDIDKDWKNILTTSKSKSGHFKYSLANYILKLFRNKSQVDSSNFPKSSRNPKYKIGINLPTCLVYNSFDDIDIHPSIKNPNFKNFKININSDQSISEKNSVKELIEDNTHKYCPLNIIVDSHPSNQLLDEIQVGESDFESLKGTNTIYNTIMICPTSSDEQQLNSNLIFGKLSNGKMDSVERLSSNDLKSIDDDDNERAFRKPILLQNFSEYENALNYQNLDMINQNLHFDIYQI
ncbi:uncharacterized protein LOC135922372 isoform X2 [Gordionus sp. m RMFG-2023]